MAQFLLPTYFLDDNVNDNNQAANSCFTTNLTRNEITLNDVILKDTYVLKRFVVTNQCNCSIKLVLQPSKEIVHLVQFQSENENIKQESLDFANEPVQPDHFNQVSRCTLQNTNFRKLLNDVNLIQDVIIPAKESTDIILVFKPVIYKVSRDKTQNSHIRTTIVLRMRMDQSRMHP